MSNLLNSSLLRTLKDVRSRARTSISK